MATPFNRNLPYTKFILPIIPLILAGCGEDIDKIDEKEIPTHDDLVYSMSSASTELILKTDDSGAYQLSVNNDGVCYTPYEDASVRLEVFAGNTSGSTFYTAGYSEVRKNEGCLEGDAVVTTKEGASFKVKDSYEIEKDGSVSVARNVEVLKESGDNLAFNSYFMLESGEKGYVSGYEYLLPSLVYMHGGNLQETFIGYKMADDWVLAREDRMGLPLAMMRNSSSGRSVAIADINLDYRTTSADFGLTQITDADFRFCSLGFFNRTGKPVLTYCYPGSEGDRTYADGGSQKTWSRRSHPVKRSTVHNCTFQILFGNEDSYADALSHRWSKVFDLYDPPITEVTDKHIMDISLETLNHYWMEDNGAPGFPFSVNLPSGQVNEISYDMGFVGMQIPCGYYLYRTGLETGNAEFTEKGEAILDFWADNSGAENGMPRIWWDISPWNLFRNYNDLRNMQGGMEAMVMAWVQAEKKQPGSKENWLDYCIAAADWMLSVQHSDGSWDMAYDNYGNTIDSSLLLSTCPVRFLTFLYCATGDERYREAVLKAGEFCYGQIHSEYRYVGCVIDNPYVLDRESGQKALEAFLCLYDLTGESKWLDAAVQAAYYTATFMYAWDVKQPDGNNRMGWDSSRNTTGITIISTGHSGADAGLSYNSFEYFRLYILTGDEHFLKIARILEKNTKQTMDFDGKLGYALGGLQTEALRVVTHWGDNVNVWLPWLTAAAIDSYYRMEDAFGMVEIADAVNLGRDVLQNLDNTYARTQGTISKKQR